MKNKYKIFPYLVVNFATFYLLPMLLKDTGSAMILMLVVIPLICFAIAVIYGIKNSFQWFYSVIIALLFVPTLFLFYNATAWIYSIAYGAIALFGNLIGTLFFHRRN